MGGKPLLFADSTKLQIAIIKLSELLQIFVIYMHKHILLNVRTYIEICMLACTPTYKPWKVFSVKNENGPKTNSKDSFLKFFKEKLKEKFHKTDARTS